jgi:hypothetical protein
MLKAKTMTLQGQPHVRWQDRKRMERVRKVGKTQQQIADVLGASQIHRQKTGPQSGQDISAEVNSPPRLGKSELWKKESAPTPPSSDIARMRETCGGCRTIRAIPSTTPRR